MSDDHLSATGAGGETVLPPLRRRPRRRKAVYRPSYRKLWATLMTLALLGGGGWLLHLQLTRAHYAVLLEHTPLCVLASEEAASAAVEALKIRHAPNAAEAVQFREGEVRVARAWGLHALVTVEDAVEALDAKLTAVIQGAAIIVNGKPLVLLASHAEAWRAISLMQERAAVGKTGVPTVKERLAIRPYTQAEDAKSPLPVMTAEEAADELGHPPRERYHTVKRGESFYVIARRYGTTVEAIEKLNPTLSSSRLDIGDAVRLPDIPAPITIVMRPGDR
ncbi:MAG TPA: LysM domain-containing protein [Armatimonadota bacterium]|nr:LysM domain-containing protein [Armatimonadota bacterium]HOS44801.1 LysM domain-containing protein [Armatimonadota bacterium]